MSGVTTWMEEEEEEEEEEEGRKEGRGDGRVCGFLFCGYRVQAADDRRVGKGREREEGFCIATRRSNSSMLGQVAALVIAVSSEVWSS